MILDILKKNNMIKIDKTKREGTDKHGGHCLVCGHCMAPYSGIEYGDNIIVHNDCWDKYKLIPPQVRYLYKTYSVKHITSEGCLV